MNKIVTLSRWLKRFFIFAMIWLPIPYIAVFLLHHLHYDGVMLNIGVRYHGAYEGVIANLGITQSIVIFMISVIPAIFSMIVCFYLIKLFACYQSKEIFSERSIYYLSKAGLFLLIRQIILPFVEVAQSYMLSRWSDVGLIGITFTDGDVLALVVALTVFLIANIMRQAFMLQQDVHLTI